MAKTSATMVGAFVLGGLALIVVAVLFFGSGAFLEKRVPIVSFFQGSVAGLQVGAPVTFRGVKVGEVTATGIRINPTTGHSIIQVDMNLLPDTVEIHGAKPRYDQNFVASLVQAGLTAQLVTQSYVTGLVNVDLDFRNSAQVRRSDEPSSVTEVPTVPSGLENIAKTFQSVDIASTLQSVQQTLASVKDILSSAGVTQSIKEMPGLIADLRQTVKSVDREITAFSGSGREAIAVNSAALQKTLASVQTTLDSVQTLSATINREAVPAFAAARGTLQTANTAFEGASALFDPRSRTMVQVQRAVEDLSATAARLRDMSERIDRDPSVLIRGKR